MSNTPRVFVSSSSESKPVAEAVARSLEALGIEVLPWWQAFPPGRYIADTLIDLPDKVDAAVFVFGKDDEIHSRDVATFRPRDNVVMEYGIFASRLELKRCLICLMESAVPPTNLDGVVSVPLRSAEEVKNSDAFRRWVAELSRPEDWQLKAFWSQAAQGQALIVYPNLQQEFAENVRLPGLVTGSGEAAATYCLGRTLERFEVRGSVLGTDSTKGLMHRAEGLVILLGSQSSNELVARLPAASDWKPRFHFKKIETDPSGKFDKLGIEDTRIPSRRWAFDGDMHKGTDHALITFVAGAGGKRQILALGGLSTLGTQAAVEFVCDWRGIKQILSQIGETPGGNWSARTFEVVLEVPILNFALDAGTKVIASNLQNGKLAHASRTRG